jgi:hypothetical protein
MVYRSGRHGKPSSEGPPLDAQHRAPGFCPDRLASFLLDVVTDRPQAGHSAA